jgi:hypothetical protein
MTNERKVFNRNLTRSNEINVRFGSWLCENPGAVPTIPNSVQFSPVLIDQKLTDLK